MVANAALYRDLSPKQIVPRLADEEGVFPASESTFCRVLGEADQSTHRQRARPTTGRRPRAYAATGPNQVWTSDITWLRGPIIGTLYYLYLVIDVWRRQVVGGRPHDQELSQLASELFLDTCTRLGLDPEGLVLHADNDSPMEGSTLLATLQGLGAVPSFSHPGPRLPGGGVDLGGGLLAWHNTEHRHSAIGYVTPPAERHDGREAAVLKNATIRFTRRPRHRHPERWFGATRNWDPIEIAHLNPKRKHRDTGKAARSPQATTTLKPTGIG